MTNRPNFPDDEPVIGAPPKGFPTERLDAGPVIGSTGRPVPPRPVVTPRRVGPPPLPEVTPEIDYYDNYDEGAPTRNPWFYAFLAAVAVIGAALVFVFVRSIDIGGNNDEPNTATVQPAALQAVMIAPRDGDRVKAGDTVEFVVRIASSQAITRVELLIDNKAVAEGKAVEAPGATPVTTPVLAKLYDATLTTRLAERGDHTAVVRVTAGAATISTATVRLVVFEEPTDPRITARVVATASVRSGPAETWPEVTRLQPGAEVRLVARTRDSEWLQIDDSAGERWIRRNAVSESGSLSTLPIRDVTATPPPTATATPPTTPTPSTANLPDFSPSDARFVFADRGRAALRVTIKNDGADFSGPLVIEAVTSPGSLLVSPLVFDINLRTGRVATVDFEVTGALPDRADVTVRVDPENAIEESNEDNNTVGFTGVRAPADPPEISISSATIVDGQINVTVTNLGGQLAPTEVSVVVEVGTNQSQSKRVLSLDTDESAHFQVPVPAAGTATVRVLLNGATAATGTVQIPGTATATATTASTTTGTPTP